MEASRRILVVLAAVFVAAECFIPSFKRESDPLPPNRHETSCHNKLASCMAPFHGNPLLSEGNHIFITLILHTDEICSLYEQASSCIRPSLDECGPGLRAELEQTFSIGDFFCSERGRSLLREVRKSVCLTDSLKAYELQAAVELCIAESANGEGAANLDPCQQIVLTQRCRIQSTTQQCGEAAGVFVSEIYDRLGPMFSELQCPEEGSHEFLKRGIELLRKRFI
ncbi:unnamed protein product [Candidula unifasciata]|uniref:Secreted protein n=1 Tax=Candidula unifasciata TaxID=100452 RepID=A0A8S4A834_9EUPU|nr:unnamed protein product [Candidula unifasciata]